MKKIVTSLLALSMIIGNSFVHAEGIDGSESEDTQEITEESLEDEKNSAESFEEQDRILESENEKEYPEKSTSQEESVAETITITFDKNANDATGEMEEQEFIFREEKPLYECTYELEGYRFTSWNTEKDGSGTTFTNCESVVFNEDEKANIILYAQWEKREDYVIEEVTLPTLSSRPISDVNTWLDNEITNGVSYRDGQCVWFCNHYLSDFWGLPTITGVGQARNWKYHRPEGWETVDLKGTFDNCRMGDLLIEDYDPGHVSVYYAKENGKHYVVDQNSKPEGGSGMLMYAHKNRLWATDVSKMTCFRPPIDYGPKRGSEMPRGYDRVLPDGDYIIVSAANPNYYLDIIGADKCAKNGDNVNLWHSDSISSIGDVDAWTLQYSDGFYRISQYGQSMSLDVNGGDTLCGKNVNAWQNNDSSAQKWAISAFWQNGEIKGYRLQAKCSGYSLDINGGTIAEGTNVQQWENNDNDSQRWLLIPYKPKQTIQDGKYIIVSAQNTNYQLDVAGNSLQNPNGTNVQIWRDDTEYWHTNANSQYNIFNVKHIENGYYRLELEGSGTSLDVYSGGPISDLNINIWQNNGSPAQLWAITPQNNGYQLRAKCNGFSMDLENGNAADGTNIRIHIWNGSLAQTWYFVQAEYPIVYDANGGENAPADQVKYYKGYLTLSNSIPTRKGYTFSSWNTKPDGSGDTYEPGKKILEDKELTLYAQWESNRMLGDVDNNGDITVSDIIMIRDIILEEPNTINKIDSDDRWAADVNQDNTVTVSDIILVRDRILGIVDEDYKTKSKLS